MWLLLSSPLRICQAFHKTRKESTIPIPSQMATIEGAQCIYMDVNMLYNTT